LRTAIADRNLKFAADVFEGEPESGDAEFADRTLAGQIVCTPHIGASTDQTSEAIGREVVRIVREYIEFGNVATAVNMLEKSPATHHLIVRHFNRVGVLATILDGLREEQINVEEMQNRIFDQMAAAVCTLALDSPPSREFLAGLAQDENVLQVTLSEAVRD
jgi:D-3-phosphoglycerate dehydrogenase